MVLIMLIGILGMRCHSHDSARKNWYLLSLGKEKELYKKSILYYYYYFVVVTVVVVGGVMIISSSPLLRV